MHNLIQYMAIVLIKTLKVVSNGIRSKLIYHQKVIIYQILIAISDSIQGSFLWNLACCFGMT